MTTPGAVAELLAALRRTLGPRWEYQTGGIRLTIRHRDAGSPYRPARRPFDWADLLARQEAAFAEVGVPRAPVLPLRWGRETDLTISAVQALDPYVKHRKPYVYREGYLPQPVVRFTGERDERGRLRDGFLTSFINTSHVRRVTGPDDIAAMLDQWLTVLSRLGLHARHLGFHAKLATWKRDPVEGITLHYDHAGIPLGDLVWIWNQVDPTYMVGDLGSGLERLAWTMTRRPWAPLVLGPLAVHVDATLLDALRTATLIAGSGIRVAARGPGAALRRTLSNTSPRAVALGLDGVVGTYYEYWSLVAHPISSMSSASRGLHSYAMEGPDNRSPRTARRADDASTSAVWSS